MNSQLSLEPKGNAMDLFDYIEKLEVPQKAPLIISQKMHKSFYEIIYEMNESRLRTLSNDRQNSKKIICESELQDLLP